MSLAAFTLLVRDRGGYLGALLERCQGHEMTDDQIAGLYRKYLLEGGRR
jgi:hypothetical protein